MIIQKKKIFSLHNYLLLAINFNVSFTAKELTNVTFFAVSVIKATVAATLEQGESLVFAAKLTWALAAPRTVINFIQFLNNSFKVCGK